MPNGTVKFFNAAKGFGFITSDEGGKDVFIPATSVASAGVSGLKAGQRLSFETLPDSKGPKAVDLKIVADVYPTQAPKKDPAPGNAVKQALTIYLDPACEAASEALAELRDAGYEPNIVDYIAAPPTKDELKKLSLLLRDGNQSLVRRYEPLFMELRLDDRFISDSEFWEAVYEHPSLINGPVVATATRASICRSESAVKSFLASISSGGAQPVLKPKGLSKRLLQLIAGSAITPPAAQEMAAEKIEEVPAEKSPAKPKPSAVKKAKAEPKTKAKVLPAPKAKPKAAGKASKSAKKADQTHASKSRGGPRHKK